MRSVSRLSYAITVVLNSCAAGGVSAAAAPGDDAAAAQIQPITVTAQRREENLEDVPITIQALTANDLAQLNVATFDEFVRYLPNVSSASNGPGQGNIFMRGLATTSAGVQGSGTVTGFPNVALYLDDQSVQLSGRNLDVYAVDLERIEVLEGPQGTLFGAGAQAGVIRYITQRPRLEVTEGGVNAGYAYTRHGDPSSAVDAMLNVPLIEDTLAVRAVIYSETRGGYIDNVPGIFVRQSTDAGIGFAGYPHNQPGPPTPTDSANDSALVANAINPVTYQGLRVSGLYSINERWNVLLTESYQSMDAQGVFYQTPQSSGTPPQNLPDLSVQLYNPSYDKDRFANTALTITGRLGDLKLLYAGSYLVRNISQVQDYTNYARGFYADYYQCLSPAQTGKPAQCFSPSSTWRDREKNTHDSQELRLSTADERRWRGIAGLFWEDYRVYENTDWEFKTAPGFTATAPPAGTDVINPAIRNANDAFFNDITKAYRQKALYASGDVDLIPQKLTATLGTRRYSIDTTATGYSASSFGCYADGPPPCTGNIPFSNNLTAEHLNKTYTGLRSRANLSFKATEDALIYYTWSEGFRAGGFNFGSSVHLDGTYKTPIAYAPDSLTNNELGWKTLWFAHRVQWNGALYQEDWNNVQVLFFDPCCLGNLSFTTNGPKYRVRGVETQVVARLTPGLTVTAAAAWNSSDLTNSPYLIGIHGQPITSIPNPYGTTGSPLAQSPPFEGNIRARYQMTLGPFTAFWQFAGLHQAHSYSQTGNIVAYVQAPFTQYDAAAGVAKDAWSAQLYGQNLTDTRADLYANSQQFVKAETVSRPRTAGVKFTYRF
jgi:outer membrane receptor protein involved in Fe transport